MLSLSKCTRCGRIYPKIRSVVCLKCQDAEDADYEKIRDLLFYEPNLTAEEVAAIGRVDVKCVIRMINAGMITSTLLATRVSCGRCGAPALSPRKRLCARCWHALDLAFAETLREMRAKQKEMGSEMGVHKTLEEKRKV